ncbi:MAG: hypothetical protein NUV87_01710 [Candidatus Roizmanbacteria bacterium]|nr:hypothetical protein [Candidatus Roizmanbacteria bacterium]MCR4313567.1 hypothetical protein [Candidatus Roizmanbacteria bacterium]
MNVTCEDCYQNPVDEMRGRPFYLSGIPGDSEEATPRACFFHVCGIGVIAAINALRENRDSEEEFLPFGSEHKPFINGGIEGRFVVNKKTDDGFQRGDVLILMRNQKIKLTNIFTYKPPRQ